jgi:hypothetical protein
LLKQSVRAQELDNVLLRGLSIGKSISILNLHLTMVRQLERCFRVKMIEYDV